MNQTADGANVRFPPTLGYLAGLALGLAADRSLNLPGLGIQLATRNVAGVAIHVVGFLIMFAGAGVFLRRRTATRHSRR